MAKVKRRVARSATAKKSAVRKSSAGASRSLEAMRKKWRDTLAKSQKVKKEIASKMDKLKKEFKHKMEAACKTHYDKGRDEERRVQEKRCTARDKVIQAAISKFDKAVVKKTKKTPVKRRVAKKAAPKKARTTTARRRRPVRRRKAG